MTRQELLVEQYEDALFALVMDKVAEVEGQKAIEENQRLKASGEVVIPEELNRRCKQTIRCKTAEKHLKRYGKGFGKVLNKVAIVALMALLLFTTAFATSESFRVKTLNFVMEVFDDRTEIKFVPKDTAADSPAVPEITAGWLPEGFELTREESAGASRLYAYGIPGERACISVNIMEMTSVSMVLDTEDANSISQQVQGEDAIMVDKGNIKQLAWKLHADENWYCCVITENISEEDMLKFAENILVK